jgi:hypothetical protein
MHKLCGWKNGDCKTKPKCWQGCLVVKRVSDYNPKGGNVPQPPLKKSRYFFSHFLLNIARIGSMKKA